MTEFQSFAKIARLSREVIVTEKIDGTNAQIYIEDDGITMHVGSRNRWITPEDDNYGFAKWVAANRDELLTLGPGHHFGEWWGQGIQRNYAQTSKRFSLFNVTRWANAERPACCEVVPELYRGVFEHNAWAAPLALLRLRGSMAAPGFMQPEGIVLFHTASGALFKKTLEGDESPKGKSV